MTDGDPLGNGGLSGKIVQRHQERLAIVYIRQSTVQQVERHQESTRLQYALVDRAFRYGWAREMIVVIDDDLGRSGSTIEGRLGFQRLVAEVGIGHVGLVLGIEMSRLARSCRDWHQLPEICALFDTLIGDADGIYDPANYNDRRLLGLERVLVEVVDDTEQLRVQCHWHGEAPHTTPAHTAGCASEDAQHIQRVGAPRRRLAPGRLRLRQDRRRCSMGRLAPGQATRHVQRPHGASSADQGWHH